MLGQVEHDKKVFVAHNVDYLKFDSARSGGEYIEAYATLAGCNQQAKLELSQVFQKNFVQIFGGDNHKQAQQIYESMEEVISNDKSLNASCHVDRKQS